MIPPRLRIENLFRMGQAGWAHWFDNPSLYPGGNHLYLYQDSAGTTPVTAVGQIIGLSLDRAFGGRTDGSLIASGATGLTGTATAASYNTSTGAGSVSRAGNASNQSWVTWTGLTTSAIHRIRVTNTGATSLDVRNGGVAGTIVASIAAGATSYVHPLTSGGSTSITITATNNSTTATFTVLEFCRVPGTHLIQATGTARPTLSARVNGLVGTEGAFSGASWTKVGSPTITLTAGAGPRGESADLISNLNTLGVGTSYFFNDNFSTALSGASVGSSYVPRIQIKRVSTSGTVTITNPSTAANGRWNINLALLSDSWEVITATHAAVTVVAPFSVAIAGQAGILFTASATGVQFYCTQADIRTADDAAKNIPVYQRVGATAADHDTDGFPHGQYPDGTDDNQTTTTGGGGTTGFFYCGAITVSGGAGTARTIWSDTGTNTGYRVRVNSSDKLELAAGNGSAYTTVASNETITAPGTYILSAWDDGGVLAVQVNNLAPATTTRPTVSAGTAAITAYKDNGAASSYFNGRDYGSVYRQSYIGESQHARLKRWLADRARITL